jgi:hypothetical protein
MNLTPFTPAAIVAGPQGPQGQQGPQGIPGRDANGVAAVAGGAVITQGGIQQPNGAGVAGGGGGGGGAPVDTAAIAKAPAALDLLAPGKQPETWVGCFIVSGGSSSSATQVTFQVNPPSGNSTQYTFSRTFSAAPQATNCTTIATAPSLTALNGTLVIGQTVGASSNANTYTYQISLQLGPTWPTSVSGGYTLTAQH